MPRYAKMRRGAKIHCKYIDSDNMAALRTFSDRGDLLLELERLSFGVPPDSLEKGELRDDICHHMRIRRVHYRRTKGRARFEPTSSSEKSNAEAAAGTRRSKTDSEPEHEPCEPCEPEPRSRISGSDVKEVARRA